MVGIYCTEFNSVLYILDPWLRLVWISLRSVSFNPTASPNRTSYSSCYTRIWSRSHHTQQHLKTTKIISDHACPHHISCRHCAWNTLSPEPCLKLKKSSEFQRSFCQPDVFSELISQKWINSTTKTFYSGTRTTTYQICPTINFFYSYNFTLRSTAPHLSLAKINTHYYPPNGSYRLISFPNYPMSASLNLNSFPLSSNASHTIISRALPPATKISHIVTLSQGHYLQPQKYPI